jgi:DNA-binding LytR/AlgR family response regulator
MSTPALEIRSEHPFWRWQALGWLAYGVAMFAAAVQELSFVDALLNKTGNAVIGFSLSLVLREIYLRLRARDVPIALILMAMLASCLIAGAVWSTLANSLFWFYMLGDLTGIAPRHFFAWTLVHAIVLVAWSAIYLGAGRVDELQRAAVMSQAAAETAPPLVVRAEGELLQLPQDEIHCIEAARNYSCIVSDAGTHVVRMPLSQLAARLDSQSFIRVHRSAIVAIDRLRSLRSLPTHDAVATLAGGREIRVSRGFRSQVENALVTRNALGR